jgi:succinylglutamate desuccinylase
MLTFFSASDLKNHAHDAKTLLSVLKQPAAVYFESTPPSKQCLIISVLIHGNEPCGLHALQYFLQANYAFTCNLTFLVMNVEAARTEPLFTHRYLPSQQDFNRIFVPNPITPDEQLAQTIQQELAALKPIACLDIHSYTSAMFKPHAYIADKDIHSESLAKELVDTIVKEQPGNQFYGSFSHHIPSLLLECGMNHSSEATAFAIQAILTFEKYMVTEQSHPLPATCYKVIDNIRLCTSRETKKLIVNHNVSCYNFLPSNTTLPLLIAQMDAGSINQPTDLSEYFISSSGKHPGTYFTDTHQTIRLKQPFSLALISADESRMQDSGFYILETCS